MFIVDGTSFSVFSVELKFQYCSSKHWLTLILKRKK